MAFSYPRCFEAAPLLGLDIDQSAIRIVELSRRPDRSFQLERYAHQALPPGMLTDEHIHHPGQLAEHIGALAQRLGSRCKRVALALPAHAVITRQLRVPADIAEDALNALMTAEASRYLTVAPDDVRVDYQFGSGSGNDNSNADDPAQRDIVLAAARREQVEDRIAAVEAAGLIPAVLDIDLYAAHAACVHAAAQAPAPSALLMLGASTTRIALFDRRQLLYHRELPGFAADTGNDAITNTTQIAVAATRAIQLAAQPGTPVQHIYIGGNRAVPGSLMQVMQAMQAMQEQSAIACSTANPFAAMPAGKKTDTQIADSDSDAAAYLVACGLAMRKAAR